MLSLTLAPTSLPNLLGFQLLPPSSGLLSEEHVL